VIFRRAHKVWLLYVGEKKEEEAQKVCPKPEASKCVLVRKNRKSTHPLESLFSPLFSTAFCVRLRLRTGLFFSLFSPIVKKQAFELEIPPF
tara:strand:+ start:1086 stop:1358 length:273 start_codon:yes stop_codon:yes gene_type:complete